MAQKVTNQGTKDWGVTTFPKPVEGHNKCYILPGAFYREACFLMAQGGYVRAESVDDADVVVFLGGSDINPKMYKEKPIAECSSWNDERDKFEAKVYAECVAKRKVMFGICRGAQILHVLNGGDLWQHVNNHAGKDHWIVDIDEDVRVKASSLHHQMLQNNRDLEIIAICESSVASVFKCQDLHINLEREGANAPAELEIEAGYYEKTRCFFVQGHPEVGNIEYRSWTLTKLADLMYEWLTTPDDKVAEESEEDNLSPLSATNILV